jgi:DNA-binding LacI/PurR family transcriptional regulator
LTEIQFIFMIDGSASNQITEKATGMAKASTPVRSTIEDVATQAGVSIATVSRVINQTGAVAAKTADRVWAAIADLDYIPAAAARGLATRKTNTIGMILPNIGNHFLSSLFKGLAACVTENGYTLLMYSTQRRFARKSKTDLSLPVGEHNTDGLIIFSDALDEAEITRLYKRKLPMVLLHRSPPAGVAVPCVTFENKKGARALVEHLIQVHHYQRIAFLTGFPHDEDSYWRELGYREALAAHGIAFDPALVGLGGFNEKIAEATVEQWLQAGIGFDAIFAADGESALGAMAALERAGKRIPQEVAVVGFDDIVLARYLTPPLTTVHAPIEQAGWVAVETLLQLIQTGQAEPLVLLETELVIRRSCGC